MTSVDNDVLQKSFARTGEALVRLAEVVSSTLPDKALLRDATIQRFEFCYELMWKLFRKIHITRGLKSQDVRRPFECIAEAGAAGWLGSRSLWEQMIEDRNITSHEYDETAADKVYARICSDYLKEMQQAFAHISEKFSTHSPLGKWQERKE